VAQQPGTDRIDVIVGRALALVLEPEVALVGNAVPGRGVRDDELAPPSAIGGGAGRDAMFVELPVPGGFGEGRVENRIVDDRGGHGLLMPHSLALHSQPALSAECRRGVTGIW